MSDRPPLLDTNVLVSLFDADAPGKRAASRRIVEACFRGEAECSVLVQNLAEFSVVVTGKVEHPMPTDEVRQFVKAVAGFDGYHGAGYGAMSVDRALEVRERDRFRFRDALLDSTMLEHGIGTVFSEDAHLSCVPGIAVVDPFSSERPGGLDTIRDGRRAAGPAGQAICLPARSSDHGGEYAVQGRHTGP